VSVEGGILFWRVRLLHIPIALISGPFVVAAMVAGMVLHESVLLRTGFIGMAVYLASNAVRQGLRLRFVLSIGRWTGWRREPIRRVEEPLHYWVRTTAEVLACLIYGGAAAFLTYMGLGPLAG
jgi:hypothetical protein